MSKLTDIMTAPWAIMPDMLCEIGAIYNTHMRGDKIDIPEVEARLGRPLNNEHPDVEVVDGVAIITAEGVIAKRMNLFSRISGGVSTELLGNQIQAALDDPQVSAVLLDIDSPGGTVDGTFELADRIFEARGEKKIVALANGLMASAAYAIGAACDAIYMTGPATHVGSIGVVTTHVDYSKSYERVGIKPTEIYAGKYKRIATQYAPLSEEGKQYMQDGVDFLYSLFVERVAEFRGVPVSTVLEDMADGRVFIGQQAIDAGLVDGVSTLEGAIAALSAGELPAGNSTSAGDAQDNPTIDDNQEDITMSEEKKVLVSAITPGYIMSDHPDIAEQLRSEGADQARQDGADAERERIQGVLEHSMAGHEDLINTLAFDGKTTPDAAAAQVLKAEKANKKQVGADIAADAAAVATIKPGADAGAGNDDPTAGMSEEEKLQYKWDHDESARAEFPSYSSFAAFEKNKGKTRIAGKR